MCGVIYVRSLAHISLLLSQLFFFLDAKDYDNNTSKVLKEVV